MQQQKPAIAIVVCAWPPSGGGIGNNAYWHAKKLSERGYPIGVFTPDFFGIDRSADGFLFKPLRTFLRIGKAGFLIGLGRQLKESAIIHLYYPFFGTDLIVWFFKKKHPEIKLVLHYEMDPIGQGMMKAVFWLYQKLTLGALVKAADYVGMLSQDHGENSRLRKYLARWPDKFGELPNGIDTEIFQPQPKNAELMKTNNFSVQDKVIIFVGGLDRQHFFKGVPTLLQAFKDLPAYYFPMSFSKARSSGGIWTRSAARPNC